VVSSKLMQVNAAFVISRKTELSCLTHNESIVL